MLTKTLQTILKRYNVSPRNTNQIVEHQTYKTKTILNPEQFAVFEAALKAITKAHFIANIINNHPQDTWHNHLLKKNNIPPIQINITDVKSKIADQASQDYLKCKSWLSKQNGLNTQTNQPINLYFACLD